jgi:hypothetical protein
MMLLPLTQCLRVDQLRASFQKHVSEIIRNINDNICSMVVDIIWRGILVREAREAGIQIVLLLRELISCRKYSSFEIWREFFQI